MKLNSWEINQQRGWVKKNIAYKKKRVLYKAIEKCQIKSSRRALGTIFNCTGEVGMDNFGCLNSSLSLFFSNEPAKKKTTAYVRLKLNLNPPPIRVSRLLAESPLLLSAYLLYWWPPGPLQKQKGTGSFHTADGEIP